MRKRENWIDYLKVFTIFCVIVGHCLDGYLKSNMFPAEADVFYEMRYVIYSFHMPLFFMISGYTFSIAYISQENEIKKERFMRQLVNIFLTYCIWGVLLWVTKIVGAPLVNTKYGINDLLNMFINPLGNYWYLYVLFIFYATVYILKINKISDTIMYISIILLLLISGVIKNIIPYTAYRVLFNIPFFCFGMLMHKKSDMIINRNGMIVSFIITSHLWALYLCLDIRIVENIILKPLIAMSESVLLMNIFYKLDKVENRFMKLCGVNCIYIYLIHPYITAGNRKLLTMIGIHNAWLSLVVNALMALMVSFVMAEICKKIYITDVLFKPINVIERIKNGKNR